MALKVVSITGTGRSPFRPPSQGSLYLPAKNDYVSEVLSMPVFKGESKNGKKWTGVEMHYDASGKNTLDIFYKDGQPTGRGKAYAYDRGWKWRWYEGMMTEEGEISGKGMSYFRAGKEKYKGNFKAGKYHGKGDLFKESNVHTGESILLYTGEFKEGLYSGHGKLYYNTALGMLRYDGNFEEGLYSGHGKLYYNTVLSRLKYEGNHKKGKAHGRGVTYYCVKEFMGKIKSRGTYDSTAGYYKGYLKIGQRYDRDSNGMTEYDGDFVNTGKFLAKGVMRHYDVDGEIMFKVNIYNKKPTDEWTLYKPGKKVWYVGEVDNDINHPHGKGTVYYVDRPGVVEVEDAIYQHGKLTNGTKVDFHSNGAYKYKVWIDRNSSEKTMGMLYNSKGKKRYYGLITEEGKPQDRGGKIYFTDTIWLIGKVNDTKFLEKSENSVRIFHYIDYNWVEQRFSNERSPERSSNEKRKREDTTRQDKNDDGPQPPNKKQKLS